MNVKSVSVGSFERSDSAIDFPYSLVLNVYAYYSCTVCLSSLSGMRYQLIDKIL